MCKIVALFKVSLCLLHIDTRDGLSGYLTFQFNSSQVLLWKKCKHTDAQSKKNNNFVKFQDTVYVPLTKDFFRDKQYEN